LYSAVDIVREIAFISLDGGVTWTAEVIACAEDVEYFNLNCIDSSGLIIIHNDGNTYGMICHNKIPDYDELVFMYFSDPP
jgi:hypothetical protein